MNGESSVWLEELLKLFPEQATIDPATLQRQSRDASLFVIRPAVSVAPHSVGNIQELVRFAKAHATEGASLTVRSGGTDMTGGPLTSSIVVDMQRHFTRIGDVAAATVTAQPGVFYRDFERVMLRHNLLMPSYPASREICTIGGMVANNAGGEKTLKYGKTARYVNALKVVLADGEEYTLKPLSKAGLEAKIKESTFEGKTYRALFTLLDHNYALIQQARPQVSKNSSGYALWDVWNRETGVFDLTKLFVGSQGTLGIITDITFRLVPPEPASAMLVVFLSSLTPLANVIRHILRYQPETFESYDHHTLKLALKFLPALFKQMKTSSMLRLMIDFLPEAGLILRGGLPQLVLLAEFTGQTQQQALTQLMAAHAALQGLPVQTRVVRSKSEAEKYWTIRRESFNLLRQKVAHMRTAPFIDDIIVPPQSLQQFLPRLESLLNEYDITYTIAGHVGDGNFHIIPLMDPKREDFANIIKTLGDQVAELVLEFHGSLSAEHNDGIIRGHYLKQMFGPEMYRLFEKTKLIFDPDGIFNPGKKLGTEWDEAKHYLDI